MKYTFLLLAAICIISGCKKKSDAPKMVYSLNGLADVTVGQYVDTTFFVALGATYESGPQEAITITPDSLPAGLTVSPASASGTPTFATIFTFHGRVNTAGAHPILITTNSAVAGKKSFHFNLIATPNPAFTYGTTINDISIAQYVHNTFYVPVSLSLLTGFTDTVTVTPDNTVAGISFSPTSISGKPNFSGALTMTTGFNTPGTHPVTVTTSSASTTPQTHTFNVIVTPSTDCAPEIFGVYTTVTTCSPHTIYDGTSSYLIEDAHIANKADISLPCLIIRANINCASGTFTTDPYTFSGLTATGLSGDTFNDNTVICHYTLSGSINATCTTTYTR